MHWSVDEQLYEFIKFVQEYRYGYTCYFYTLDENLEKMFEIRTRENSSKAEYKEAGAYFDGDKSLEEVSSVIYGRVQLWLDECK